METQVFEKLKGNLSSEKKFAIFLSRLVGCNKPQETIRMGPNGFLTVTVEVIWLLL